MEYENEISQNTVFSGADATIVAYRDISTPAVKFRIEELEQQLRSIASVTGDWGPENPISDFLDEAVDSILGYRGGGGIGAGGGAGSSWTPNPKKDSVSDAAQNSAAGKIVDGKPAYYPKKTTAIAAKGKEIENIQKEIKELKELKYFILGTIHTLSYSSFREKFAVRGLGTVAAKTYTRGPRTVSGTMIFNTVQEQELLKLSVPTDKDKSNLKAVMLDQVEPFHLMILLANEYGSYSALHLINVEIAAEGESFSIDDVVTRNTMNYYATDFIPPVPLGTGFRNYQDMINGQIRKMIESAGDIINNRLNIKNKIDYAGHNPFAANEDFLVDLVAQSRGLF